MFAGGIEGQIQTMKSVFPDHHLTIDDMLAEGDRVAVRVTVRGINTGPMVGLPAFGCLETPVAAHRHIGDREWHVSFHTLARQDRELCPGA